MKSIVITAWILMIAYSLFAQESDSIRTEILSEVVIEGSRMEDDTLQNFYRSNAAATTETILGRMKGVTLIRRGAYGQEPVLRGMSNGQVNVTIDGMKLFGACTDKMDPVTIYVEPWNLSSIQILPGAQGQFGSTIGGAFNMKLAQPVVGQPGVNGKAGIDFQSSSNSFNYFSVFNVSKNSSAYRANLTYRNSNNYYAGGGQEIEFSQYEKVNFGVAGKWALKKYDTLQADVLFDKGWNIGFPALPMDVGKATAGIYSITYRRMTPLLFFSNFNSKVYYNSITHNMDDTHRDVEVHMDMPGKSETLGMWLEGDIHIFHKHLTMLKTEYFTNSSVGEMTMYPAEGPPMYMQTAPKARRQSVGLFLTQQIRINSTHRLMLSLRTDLFNDYLSEGIGRRQWEIFDSSVKTYTANFLKTFSINYVYNLNKRTMLEFQGGYGERMSTLNECYGFYLFSSFDGYDYLGNPDLKNERSWNAEATINYFTSKIEIQLTPFLQQVENYIMGQIDPDLRPMTVGAHGVKQYVNRERAYLSGVDFMMMVNAARVLQWITTVKYTYGTVDGMEALPLIAPLTTVTSLRLEINKWNFQGEWELSAAQNHVSGSSGEQKTPGYSIVSLRTGLSLNSIWQLNGGIENLLDSNYREHLDWGGIPRPGRNIYLNVIFKFSKK